MTQMLASPFRIKICGITSPADARVAADAGADAIGLNFHPPSPRAVDLNRAEEIADAVRGRLKLVGVFVNQDAPSIETYAEHVELDAIQLHGDEPPQTIVELAPRTVIRALRCRNRQFEGVQKVLADWESVEPRPAAVILDAWNEAAFGGTGRRLDWTAVAGLRSSIPIVLAGGLTADNVAEAIATARPQAVDCASGVESEPGVKDAELVRRFVSAARKAFV